MMILSGKFAPKPVKLNLYIIFIFYSKMNKVRYTILVKGKQYYIHSHCKEEKEKKYIGEFEFSHNVHFGNTYYLTFKHVKSITENVSAYYLSFCPRDTYYDVEKVRKNAQ